MSKLKMKKIWESEPQVNYDNVIVKQVKNYYFAQEIEIDNKRVIFAVERNKIVFLNPHTLEYIRKPFVFIKNVMSISNLRLLIIDGMWYFCGQIYNYQKPDRIFIYNVNKDSLFDHQCGGKWIDEFFYGIAGIAYVNFDNTDYMVVCDPEGGIIKYEITTGNATVIFEKPDIFEIKMKQLDDTSLRLTFSDSIAVLDMQTCEIIRKFQKYGPDGYEYSQITLNIDGLWVTVTCNTYYSKVKGCFIWNSKTGELISEILGDGNPENEPKKILVVNNDNGELLLILYNLKCVMVYNFRDLEKGFRYLTDKKSQFYFHDLMITHYQGETVIMERSGKMWSAQTLKQIKNITLLENYLGWGEPGLKELLPITLPDRQSAFFLITNGNVWNPGGKVFIKDKFTNLNPVQLNNNRLMAGVFDTNEIRVYDIDSRLLLHSSGPLEYKIIKMITAEISGEQRIIAELNNKTVIQLRLEDLEPTGPVIELSSWVSEIYIVEINGKTQFLANIDSQKIYAWDAVTGKLLKEIWQITNKSETGEPDYLDIGLDIETQLLTVDKQPVLAVTVLGLDICFFWNLETDTYIGNLEFDKKLFKYADEDTGLLDVVQWKLINNSGKLELLTAFLSEVLVWFDWESKKRLDSRPVKRTGMYIIEKMEIFESGDTKFAVLMGEGDISVFDLQNNKKIKKIEYEVGIDDFCIFGNTLIVSYGGALKGFTISAG